MSASTCNECKSECFIVQCVRCRVKEGLELIHGERARIIRLVESAIDEEDRANEAIIRIITLFEELKQ